MTSTIDAEIAFNRIGHVFLINILIKEQKETASL